MLALLGLGFQLLAMAMAQDPCAALSGNGQTCSMQGSPTDPSGYDCVCLGPINLPPPLAPPTPSAHITLYEHADFGGRTLEVNLFGNQCHNVDANFNDLTSSVNSHDACVILYADYNCQGGEHKMSPAIAVNWKFVGDFNDKTSSLRGC